MTAQEFVTYAIGALAVGFLALRYLRRRKSACSCGQGKCPAAAETLAELRRVKR